MPELPHRTALVFWGWLKDWRAHVGTLALVLVVALGVNAWQVRRIPDGAAPEFTAALAGGGAALALAQWRTLHPGRAVALHFWAEWCPVCKLEENSVSAVQRDWPVLTVAMRSGDVARVQRVLAQRQLNWTTVIDPDGRLAARYGLQAVPAFIVLDPEGRIRHATVGYTPEWGMRLRLWLAQHV
jgi:thiol-disulfide isomerase/thioredoxin